MGKRQNWHNRCTVVEDNIRCTQPVQSRGYCRKHYARFWKYGDPLVCKRQYDAFGAGQRFGRLTVRECLGVIDDGRCYRCHCDCGNEIIIKGAYLSAGTKSCGCLQREAMRARAKNYHRPTYQTWRAMLQRCRYPSMQNWSHYGGRGITVCDRWQNFDNFVADMGERPEDHTLDRIDVNGHYEPSNCRWASTTLQRQNRRNTK